MSILFTYNWSVSHQQERPRIVYWPSRPLIGRSQGDGIFNWTFKIWPGKTWNESVVEVAFGIWKAPGYIRTKLMVITNQGEVLILPNYEDKLSCKFNMSRLQVAFTLHNLSVEDEKQYGLQVEFGLDQNPLMDVVLLHLHDPPEIISPLKRNIYLRTGADLDLKCEAKGLPNPQVTWSRRGRLVKNHTLVLKRVSISDSGRYLCKAFNAAGEDSMEVIVVVGDEEKATETTGLHATPSKHIQGHKTFLVAGISGCIVVLSTLVVLAVLYYRLRGRLKRSVPYVRQIDTRTPNMQPISTAI